MKTTIDVQELFVVYNALQRVADRRDPTRNGEDAIARRCRELAEHVHEVYVEAAGQ